MPTVSIVAASDTQCREANATKNYGGDSTFGVNTGNGPRLGLVFFNPPFPRGVTIISAELQLFQSGAATGGNRTISLQRAGSQWQESKVNWNNRPGGVGYTPSRTLGNSATNGRLWSFDVKGMMQVVADGGIWFGVRVTSDIQTEIRFHGREQRGAFVPKLIVTWSDAPDAPTELSPAGNRAVSVARPTFRFDYVDPSDDDPISGLQVQVSTSTSFESPVLDSGEVAAVDPEWTATADLPSGTLYWRARVQDGSGLWSGWSATAQFRRIAKPSITITAPSASQPVVYSSTPTFAWTVAGGSQAAMQVLIVDLEDESRFVFSSGKQAQTVGSYTIPARGSLVLTPGKEYRLHVRVWDAVARESIPEEFPYSEQTLNFTFGTSSATAAVTNLVSLPATGSPFVFLEWDHSGADQFLILEAGRAVATVEAADVLVSGNHYRYEVRGIRPRETRTLGVIAVKDGISSDVRTTTAICEPEGIWLYSLSGTRLSVCIADDAEGVTAEASESTAVFEPSGSRNPVIITQARRGRRGSVEGFITRSDLADWNSLADRRAVRLGLTRVDQTVRVLIFNTVRQHANDLHTDEIPVAFDYVEVS